MKTGILIISALLGSSSAMLAQNYLAYTKTHLQMVDSTHAPVKHLEQGDALYIESEKHEHGMYKVIHLKSKKKGYVSKHDVKIHREVNETEKPTLTTKNSPVKDPVIEMHNSSKHPLFVKFDDVEFEIKPHETHAIRMDRGNYYYKVYSGELEAHYEYAKLQEFKKYEWEFYVEEEPLNNSMGFSNQTVNK